MASLHTVSLCALGLALCPSIFAIRKGIREEGFWNGIKEGLRVCLFSFLFFFFIAIPLATKIFTSLIAFVDDIRRKNITIDYIPPITFDIYRGFKINEETYLLCIDKKYSPACNSLSNDYLIHDNQSRAEFYLEKIIDNEMDKCKLESNISACENIIRAYKKLDDSEKVKEYQKLVKAIREKNLERYF